MRSYISSKSPLIVDPEWNYWSRGDFVGIDPHPDQIAALLFLNNMGKLLGILGDLLNKGSTPIFAKIDANKVSSCFTIQNFNNIPKEFHPQTPIIVDTVKDTAWETVLNEIALCALSILVPIPFGIKI